MRSCLFLLGLLGAVFAQLPVSAQNVIPGNSNRAPATPAAVPVANPLGSGVGQAIPANSKLVAGDEVSILIKEDQEAPWNKFVSDQGLVELGVLGTIPVSGKTSSEAAAAISAYLEKDYYKRATVQVQILKKALGSVPFFKVTVDGKVSRAGRQLFTEADPLSLAEAVIASNPTEWANIKRVQLTRGAQSTEHDVEAITKGGRTELDVRLRDGDRIYVPKRGWKFGE